MKRYLTYINKNLTALAVIGCLTAFALTTANAQDQRQPGARGGPRGGFGLDEQQMQTFRDAVGKERDALQKLDEKLREAQKELLKVVVADKFDEKVVKEKAEAVAKIQTEMLMIRAKALSTVAPTLKDDQKTQLVDGRFGAMMLQGGFGGGFMGRGPDGAQPGGQRGPGARRGGGQQPNR